MVGVGNVTVTFENGDASYQNYRIEFINALANSNIDDITLNLTNLNLATAIPYNLTQGSTAVAETQRVSLKTDARSGTFGVELEYSGTTYTASAIDFDATANEIQVALDTAFSGIAGATISVGFWNGRQLDVILGGSLAGKDINPLVASASTVTTPAILALEQVGYTLVIPAVPAQTIVVDYVAQPLEVLVGPGTIFTLNMDGAEGEIIKVTGNVDLNLFDFATVSGGFGFEKSTQPIVLSDTSSVDTDMLTMGLLNVDAFVGYDSGTSDTSDDLGMQLLGVDLAVAIFSEQSGSRKWTSVKAGVDSASFLGAPVGLSVSVNTVSIEMNNPASDGTVVDYLITTGEIAATNLEVLVGPSTTVTFDMDDDKGEYLQVTGNAELDLFDFVVVSGGFGLEKASTTIYLSDDTSSAANLLTLGLLDVDAFVGYDKGTPDSSDDFGMQLQGVDLALALFTEQGGTRQWTSVKAGIGSAAFLGLPTDLNMTLGTASIEMNKPASDGTVIDYVAIGLETQATVLDVSVGPGTTVTFDMDDSKGEYTQITGNITLNLFDFITVSGGFGLEKSSSDVYLSDDTNIIADLLTIGMLGVDVFFGYDQGTSDSADDIGMQLLDVDLALAIFTEQGGTRNWTSVKAAVGSASFLGLPADLVVALSSAAIEINKPAADGTVVDYQITGGETQATILDVILGPGVTVSFDMDDDKGEYLQITGVADLSLFGFVTISGGFGLEKSSQQVHLADGSIVDTDMLTLGGSGLEGFVGMNGPATEPDALGLLLSSLTFGLALFAPAKGQNGYEGVTWTSLKAAADGVTFLGLPSELSISATKIFVDVNQISTGVATQVIDFSATSVVVTAGPVATITLDMKGSDGNLLRAGGAVQIGLFDSELSADYLAFEKKQQGGMDVLSVAGADISFALKVGTTQIIKLSIASAAFVFLEGGIAGEVTTNSLDTGPTLPGISLSADSFTLGINTTGQAFTDILGVAVDLPASTQLLRVKVLNGNITVLGSELFADEFILNYQNLGGGNKLVEIAGTNLGFNLKLGATEIVSLLIDEIAFAFTPDGIAGMATTTAVTDLLSLSQISFKADSLEIYVNTTGQAITEILGYTVNLPGETKYLKVKIINAQMKVFESFLSADVFELSLETGAFGTEIGLTGTNMAFTLQLGGVTLLELDITTGLFSFKETGLVAMLTAEFSVGPSLPNVDFSFTSVSLAINTTGLAVTEIMGTAVDLSDIVFSITGVGGSFQFLGMLDFTVGSFTYERAIIDGEVAVSVGLVDISFEMTTTVSGFGANVRIGRFTAPSAAFMLTGLGIAGAVDLTLELGPDSDYLPDFGFYGTYGFAVNTTGVAIDSIGGVTVDLPSELYLRISVAGGGLSVLGIDIPIPDFTFKPTLISGDLMVLVDTGNIGPFRLEAGGTRILELTTGNGLFLIKPTGIVGLAMMTGFSGPDLGGGSISQLTSLNS